MVLAFLLFTGAIDVKQQITQKVLLEGHLCVVESLSLSPRWQLLMVSMKDSSSGHGATLSLGLFESHCATSGYLSPQQASGTVSVLLIPSFHWVHFKFLVGIIWCNDSTCMPHRASCEWGMQII